MDRQLIDLAREFVELGFFTLIMLGMCTTAICLTRVWATQELIKVIGSLKPQEKKAVAMKLLPNFAVARV